MERWVRFYFGKNEVFKLLTSLEFKVGDNVILPIEGEKLLFQVVTISIDLTGADPALNLSCTKQRVI